MPYCYLFENQVFREKLGDIRHQMGGGERVKENLKTAWCEGIDLVSHWHEDHNYVYLGSVLTNHLQN